MMNCICGSDYFAMSNLVQTSPDGRANLMADELLLPWVMHFTCASCGAAYICDPKSKRLEVAGSDAAHAMIDKHRIDFTANFDTREEKKTDAPLV